ncbi:hypothetical protein Cadr_000003408 [Camelus dromedarius]|uniref:Uncharacterized protein n=1 Tax=Camelus dromedarius TaxID=9838 RepID=A0A5N4C0W0_CAMDR|nr:hypothetical protein Cadr_000003408 [Camelus dromedarius]
MAGPHHRDPRPLTLVRRLWGPGLCLPHGPPRFGPLQHPIQGAQKARGQEPQRGRPLLKISPSPATAATAPQGPDPVASGPCPPGLHLGLLFPLGLTTAAIGSPKLVSGRLQRDRGPSGEGKAMQKQNGGGEGGNGKGLRAAAHCRGSQRPPKAKAKCHCGKAPAPFSAVWGAGLRLQAPGRSAPIRSHCPGDGRAHCGLHSAGPGFLTRGSLGRAGVGQEGFSLMPRPWIYPYPSLQPAILCSPSPVPAQHSHFGRGLGILGKCFLGGSVPFPNPPGPADGTQQPMPLGPGAAFLPEVHWPLGSALPGGWGQEPEGWGWVSGSNTSSYKFDPCLQLLDKWLGGGDQPHCPSLHQNLRPLHVKF